MENAVKHGMMGKEDGVLHIALKTYEMETDYVIEIIDDGCGFESEKETSDGRSHVGIENVKSRLQSICDGELIITSKIGEGTKALIILEDKNESIDG